MQGLIRAEQTEKAYNDIRTEMKRLVTNLVLLASAIVSLPSVAQTPLSLRSAIDTALLRNLDIRIARNNLEILRQENTFGMAGGMPVVTATASDVLSENNNWQKTNNQSESSVTGTGENALSLGVNAGITLFSGLKVVATRERLNLLESRGEIALNQQIQTVVAGVMLSYYDIIRQQNYLKIIRQSLEVSEQKYAIAEVRKNIGMADAVEYLQAATDLNSARQQVVLQETMISQSVNTLRNLINIGASTFVLTDTIAVGVMSEPDSVMASLKRNLQYLSADTDVSVSTMLVKENRAGRYPSLRLNAGYDIYNNSFSKGALRITRNYGPYAGIALQIPVFSGFVQHTRVKTAEIGLLNARLEKDVVLNNLTESALNLLASYQSSVRLIGEQRSNLAMTARLVDVVLKKYHLNEATILDVKAAQSSYEQAAYQLINLIYAAKSAEIGLRQLTNSLTF